VDTSALGKKDYCENLQSSNMDSHIWRVYKRFKISFATVWSYNTPCNYLAL